MKRPAFQFYPSDWASNSNLRRCSWAARGAWIEVMGLMHDSDRYGALAWPLKEIAQALGCPLSLLKELVDKGVMKGADKGLIAPLTHVIGSGRRAGETITLLPGSVGPLWYSSRMVRDEAFNNIRREGGKEGADHGWKGSEHGGKGGRPPAKEPPSKPPSRTAENPPREQRRGVSEPPSKPPPSSSSSIIEPIPTQPLAPEPARASLPDGFDQVVAAAGLRITAKNREREAAVLAGWAGIGLGLEEIIKEIRRVLAEKDGPTSTLGRFDRGLRDLAARRALPKAEPAPAVPKGRDDCEDGPVIRQAMLAELGEKTYASWLRPCDLRREGETLIVSAPSTFSADWIRNHLADRVRVAARAKLVEVRAA